MSDVGFYHLTHSTPAQALPQLLARTLAAGQRALVVGKDVAALDTLSAALWEQPTWLPHGGAVDGDPDLQPIWLSTKPEALNGARYLFLLDGGEIEGMACFERVFDLFDGSSEASVTAARQRWKAARDAGHAITYWLQTERSWQKKT